MSSDARYEDLLERRRINGTLRSLKQHPTRLSSQDKSSSRLIDFSSNDYLSITESAAIRERFLTRLSHFPLSQPVFGSTGSRLLDGTTPAHTSLEDRLARFFDSPSALLFNSGWDANVSLFSAVPQRGDYIVYDELVHASVWDGMRTGERRGVKLTERRSFKHNSMGDLRLVLEKVITEIKGKRQTPLAELPMIFIALESLYSMDGDLAPLPSIISLLQSLSASHPMIFSNANVWVVLDEAHTTGAYGRGGRGFVDAVTRDREGANTARNGAKACEVDFGTDVMRWVKIRVMTFGKAVGGQGAVLLSSSAIRSFLINYARPFIFSTAMSVSNVIAIESAFDVLESDEGDERRARLQRICEHALERVERLLHEEAIPSSILSLLPASTSPYVSVRSRDATAILPLITPFPHSLADHIRGLGILVRPIVHPTVPKGKERVRVCLHAGNWEADVDRLMDGVGYWARHKLAGEGAAQMTSDEVKAKL